MSAMRMVAPASGLRGLILVGEDLGRLYGPEELAQLRARLDFVMVLTSFVSPVTEAAHLALPVALGAEREGTVRRAGGRLWWGERLVQPAGEAQRTTVTLEALAAGLGASRPWGDDAALWAAIREQVAGYRHVEFARLRAGAVPAVGLDSAAVADVVDSGILASAPTIAVQTDEEHPFVLVPRSSRGGWITDARCQGAHLLRREATMYREPYVVLAPDDARSLGLREGARAQVATARGAVTVRVRAEKGVPAGLAIVPTEYPGVLRALAGATEAGGLPLRPLAGSIAPAETR